MKTWVLVKPNSKKETVERLADGTLKLCVRAPATEGKANDAVVSLLSKHFSVPKSKIKIVMGLKGRKKLVEYT
jgi:hypothetical protein